MNNKYFNSPDAVKRNRLILIAITFIITLYILIRSWGILYPFVIGFVLAYLALPLVNVLEEKMPKIIRRGKLGRIIAICLVYFGLLILLVATLYLFFSVVFQQVSMLASEVPSLTNRIGNQWNEWMKEKNLLDLWDSYQKSISQDVRLQIENQLQTALQRLLDTLVNIIQQGIGNAFDVLTKTLSFILGILIVPIWLFYVLNDAKEITQAIVNIVPSNLRSDFIVVMRLIDRIFDSFIRGQLILCFIVGFLSFVGLMVMGVPYAVLLGIIAGFTEAIPMIGPLLGMIPALFIALSVDTNTFIYTFILYMVISQAEAMWLKPRIMGNYLSLHPALVMIVLFIGANIGGIIGMILSAPVTAVFRDLFKYIYVRISENALAPEEALVQAGLMDIKLDDV